MKSINKKEANNVMSAFVAEPVTKGIFGVFSYIYSFIFDPLKTDLYIAIVVLIFFDFITAIVATYKTKEEISSAKASRTLLKLVVYGILTSSAVLVDKFIFESGQLFAIVTLGFIAITEFISIMENIGRTGFVIPNKLLNKAKEIVSEQ